MPISKSKADKCTTHHCCDCYQYGIEEMGLALWMIQNWVEFCEPGQEQMVLELIMAKAVKALSWREND